MALEVGAYYRWIGPKTFRDNWNDEMDAIKGGKPHKVLSAGDRSGRYIFEGISSPSYGWEWSHVEHLLEKVSGPEHIPLNKVSIRNVVSEKISFD